MSYAANGPETPPWARLETQDPEAQVGLVGCAPANNFDTLENILGGLRGRLSATASLAENIESNLLGGAPALSDQKSNDFDKISGRLPSALYLVESLFPFLNRLERSLNRVDSAL